MGSTSLLQVVYYRDFLFLLLYLKEDEQGQKWVERKLGKEKATSSKIVSSISLISRGGATSLSLSPMQIKSYNIYFIFIFSPQMKTTH